MHHLEQKYSLFYKVYLKTFLSVEKGRRAKAQLRAQVLRVGPMDLRLRDGSPLFSGQGPLIMCGW